MGQRIRARVFPTPARSSSLPTTHKYHFPFFSFALPYIPCFRKPTADTPYRIGSVTKVVTDVMLMKLRDEGKVNLDDPVAVRIFIQSLGSD